MTYSINTITSIQSYLASAVRVTSFVDRFVLLAKNRSANEKTLCAHKFVIIDAQVEHQLVKLRTKKMFVIDLKCNAKAHNKTIQSLHVQNMAEINSIIHVL